MASFKTGLNGRSSDVPHVPAEGTRGSHIKCHGDPLLESMSMFTFSLLKVKTLKLLFIIEVDVCLLESLHARYKILYEYRLY